MTEKVFIQSKKVELEQVITENLFRCQFLPRGPYDAVAIIVDGL